MPSPPTPAAGSALDPSGLAGLSDVDARVRLEEDGPNELPAQKRRNLLATALEVAREPMFLMLVTAGSIYLAMGETIDALMLLGFVFVVMGITITQERRTERALDALRDLSSPRALVIRGGVQQRIAGRDLVRGDIVILAEGDRVPADGIVRRGAHLSVDESLLTGESVPVRKLASSEAKALDKPGGDDKPSVFSGTLVVAGQAIAEITATGLRSELGRIGVALERVQPEPTLLQTETRHLVRVFATMGLLACALVVVVYALVRGGGAAVWKQGLLAGITMAMAAIPEEFPVILTVFLALGAWRISRSHVLTRRMPAVEMLGAATVLCVDKTGTLTQNRMTLRRIVAGGAAADVGADGAALPDELHDLLENAILASRRDPFDPMELALHTAGDRLMVNTEHLHPDWTLAREYPLSPELLAVTQAWDTGDGGALIVAAKGAPEAIAGLCRLAPERTAALLADVATMAGQGLRVLGVARTSVPAADLPDDPRSLSLTFVGLLGLEDPLRPTVPAAVAECRTAGVRVVMITGDYPATAQAIARQAGLADCDTVITGPDLDGMSDADLAARIGAVQVFARVVPEQKLRLVTALKANGEIVAMTGDGVNDAPALKAAHIGIAMGGRGTDVARESAALVLLDDDFSSIVAAIRLGRRIFDNIKKAVAFILAVHVPIAGLSMIPVFFADWPLLLLPIHIVFLELIIDPACSLIFEAEGAEANVMQRPPRGQAERLFSRQTVVVSVLQGLSALAACLGVYLFARGGHTVDAARAMTFTTLVTALVVIILVNRSWVRSAVAMLGVPNVALRWVLGGAVAFLAAALLVPFAQRLFHFAPLAPPDTAISLAAGLTCVLWFEVVKAVWRHRGPSPTPSSR